MKQILLLLVLGSFAFATRAQVQVNSSTKAPGNVKKNESPDGKFPKPGEWPSFRRSGTLEAHSPLRGNMIKPGIVWKEFVGALESRIVIESGDKNTKLSLPGEELNLSAAADSIALADFIPIPKSEEDNTSSWTSTFADVLPEYPGKEKLDFESTFNKPMINGQYVPSFGTCLARQNGQWTKVWETKPVKDLFNPLPLVGDFDGDGTKEIAILPFYQMKLVDARTGQVKDSCRFNDNRSYGFHGVYDFDSDGKSEFLVQADFSKHVDVLGLRNGKLTLLWQRKIEPDIADPQKIMRVAPNPVMDIDNDGQPEVLTTIFNDAGDGRWHLTFIDAITGKTKIDFPDEVFAAPLDVDGDGISELLTTCTRGVGVLAKIRVRSVKEIQPHIIWEKENAGWQTWDPPLPSHVKSMATLGQRTVLSQIRGKIAYVVLREPGTSTLSLAQWAGSSFKPITTITGENLEGLGFDTTGRLLVRSRHRFGQPSPLLIANGNVTRHTTHRIGCATGSAVVAWPDGAKDPTIVVQGAVEEQVTFQPTNSNGGKVHLKYVSGRGQGSWWPTTLGPVVADLVGDGRRQLLVADAGPSGFARLSAKDLDGRVLWQHEFPLIAGTPPPQNTGGVILWQAGHFTDAVRQDVLVTTQRSKMHSEETFLLSGQDGHVLWHRDKQISKRAVGGNSFAVADYDGDGLDDVASLWPSILYLLKGTTGADILAMDAKWKQVYAKQVYFGQAVAGNFLNEGKPALFFSGRLMTGVIRLDGTLVWFDALDKSPGYLPSLGDFDGDGRADVVGVGYEDGVRCYDMASGQVKWRMANPADGFGNFGQKADNPVRGSASADVDGDGRDEALIAVGRTLFCLGAPVAGSVGEIRWSVELPAEIGPPTVVSLDKASGISILVVGSDGYVYCLR
ncbi:MAG TPA: VCBS repeat-containing protein [Cyclobacteriaceae bacterium]|nr:VCBS repeat-containing protein [Cyclobacteriaceae bacterium]